MHKYKLCVCISVHKNTRIHAHLGTPSVRTMHTQLDLETLGMPENTDSRSDARKRDDKESKFCAYTKME